MPSHTVEEVKKNKERDERFETEEDMRTVTRMQELLASSDRMKRLTDMIDGQESAIKDLASLKARIASKQEDS